MIEIITNLALLIGMFVLIFIFIYVMIKSGVDIKFHPMTELPVKEKNETFSVPILLYDKLESEDFCEIGYYCFETNEWNHFGESSMKLICWCYIPPKRSFINSNKNLKVEIHKGYID